MMQATDEQAVQSLTNALRTGALTYHHDSGTFVVELDNETNPAARWGIEPLIYHLEYCGAIPTVCDLEAVTRQVIRNAQSLDFSGHSRPTAYPAA